MTVKISSFEIENIKRVKAISLAPTATGLTVVGGKNEEGKTTVLQSIAWALGGDKFKPSGAQREGSVLPPHLKVTLSNGIVVERKGANGSLKVLDPSGNKAGQQLLNEFIDQLALDLPKFMGQTAKDKGKTLLQIAGVGDQLYELDTKETSLFNERTSIGRIADQKQSAADEMQSYPDAPAEAVSASELIQQQQAILATNGENQRKREAVIALQRSERIYIDDVSRAEDALRDAEEKLTSLQADLAIANKSAKQLTDESTEAIEASIAAIDQTNQKVRVNQAKALVEDEAQQYKAKYDALTADIEAVRAEKLALLEGAELPLPGLSVEDGELTYRGRKWDGLSSSEQLRVATAIVRKLNPQCGFVLLDKLEQMDTETLADFGTWLEAEGLQVIATRVSTGDECSIVIEDGYAVTPGVDSAPAPVTYTKGTF